MSLSLYQVAVPAILFALDNLKAILAKAENQLTQRKIDPSVLVGFRLYPDMLPFARQIQIACDVSVRGVARLAGLEVPSFPDTEATFPELRERIQKAQDFIKTAKSEPVDGSGDKMITFKSGGNDLSMKGVDYAQKFVLPNLYFHISIAYAILRHNGVELGKKDFLGPIQG